MSGEQWGLVVTAIVSLGTAAWTGVRTISDWRTGVHARETTTQRDTVTDRDALIDQLQEEVTRLRARVDVLEGELHAEQAHVQDLRDQIYRGEPPPPRPRPRSTP